MRSALVARSLLEPSVELVNRIAKLLIERRQGVHLTVNLNTRQLCAKPCRGVLHLLGGAILVGAKIRMGKQGNLGLGDRHSPLGSKCMRAGAYSSRAVSTSM